MANEKRLIDADALKHRMESHIATAIHWGVKDIPMGKDSSSAFEYLRGYERGAIETANLALGQPLVDAVEVVHAQWKTECKNRHKCSNCGFGRNTDTQLGWNYCPNCGAKMDGDTE